MIANFNLSSKRECVFVCEQQTLTFLKTQAFEGKKLSFRHAALCRT
jgi:hypothetical protein